MRKFKKWSIYFLFIFFVTISAFNKQLVAFAESLQQNNGFVTINQPTIMIPGTNGKTSRFDGLIDQLSKTYDVDVVKVKVSTKGEVSLSGNLSEKSKYPIIVIAFEDGSDDSLYKQGYWFHLALQALQKDYQFLTYDYLGHSNGGLVITSYLEKFNQENDPSLNKLITLGTPFNGVSKKDNILLTHSNQLKTISPQLEGYLESKTLISQTFDMLNIAGEVDDTASDNTVPVQSVFSGQGIYQEAASSYQQSIITKGKTTHSALVENQQFIQEMTDFYGWGK